MAEITDNPLARPRRAGVKRPVRRPIHTDMTPMVDLGFLLITFFIMTAELSKPSSVRLNMPKPSSDPPMQLNDKNALTVLVDEDHRLFYYLGSWEKAKQGRQVFATSFDHQSGLGKIIRERQAWLDQQGTREGRSGLTLVVKPGKRSEYQDVVDALDEVLIHAVKRYTITGAGPEEEAWLRQTNGTE